MSKERYKSLNVLDPKMHPKKLENVAIKCSLDICIWLHGLKGQYSVSFFADLQKPKLKSPWKHLLNEGIQTKPYKKERNRRKFFLIFFPRIHSHLLMRLQFCEIVTCFPCKDQSDDDD